MRRLGGSDIPKLLGISNYGGPYEVYLRVAEGFVEDAGAPAERGTMFEPVLRAHGQNFLGVELEDAASDYHPHPSLEFAHAQIDDLAHWRGMPVVVDYKTQNRFVRGWGAPETDEVPEHIRAQLAWEMLCADRELGLLVVGFGEDEPEPVVFNLTNVVTYQVERCPFFESFLVATAKEFWERHILPRSPPPKTILGKKKKAKS